MEKKKEYGNIMNIKIERKKECKKI